MSYALKTSGIALNLLACIAVDDDGTTVKDFVSGNTAVHDAGVAAPKVGAATWKGTSRGYFKTDINGDEYHARGVTWASGPTLPMGSGGTGIGFFAAINSLPGGGQFAWVDSGGNFGIAINGTAHQQARLAAGNLTAATTALSSSAKFSFGMNQKYGTTTTIEETYFYGLESGSLAADGSYTEGSFGSDVTLAMYGGYPGGGSFPGLHHIACWFNRPLTLVEMQSLHDDWFGTLFAAAETDATVSGVTDAESVPTVDATGGVNSTSITLKSDASTLLASAMLNVWTRNTIAGAAIDGGPTGLSIETDGSGVLNVTGLTISTGSRILTVQDPSDALNSHNYPVTVA